MILAMSPFGSLVFVLFYFLHKMGYYQDVKKNYFYRKIHLSYLYVSFPNKRDGIQVFDLGFILRPVKREITKF